MNALTKVKLINELNEREVELGVAEKVSWHAEYKDSAWIFLGGLPYELTEGDIICVFSQYGEIVNINLVRDKKTGKSKGFCFLCYENQRSTILAVDNFNGIKIRGRTIRVDHVANYRPPKDSKNLDDITRTIREKGCGIKTPPSSSPGSSEDEMSLKKYKKDKKEKKRKKKDRDAKMTMDKQEMPTSSSLVSQHKTRKEKEGVGFGKSAIIGLERGSSPERREGREGRCDGREGCDGPARQDGHEGSEVQEGYDGHEGSEGHDGHGEGCEGHNCPTGSPVSPQSQLEYAETSRKEKSWHKKSSGSSSRKEKRKKEKSKHRDRSRSSEKHSHCHEEHSEGRTKKRKHKHKSRSSTKDSHSRDRDPSYSSHHKSS
ncbi:RNA-binding motif protein, X-linked 2-like [Gracilinanus agilis]|uniref:RNA-binding motif protein, X-linked 2-like n=1 Tax=Gracilinanus agilis TaxID=191870 RepID=UPI001CFF0A25|nr:RNA-binding motif protein, X-linked 2-like [Gracilinanus agilis]